jgi:uncharacterized membrane protein YhfC
MERHGDYMQYEMIGAEPKIALILMILCGILLPTVVATVWKIKTKEPISTILVGAATFAVFAIGLESIPKVFLFQLDNPVSAFVLSNTWLYAVVGALLAGVFEETGRFLAFKFLLRKRTGKKTAISYGIGHGGFEAIFLLVFQGIQYLTYISLINSGQYSTIVEQVRATSPEQVAAMEALPAALAAMTISSIGISIMERVSAMLGHVAFSILVFDASRTPKKVWMYPFAIFLHAFMDIFAVFYQVGKITVSPAIFEVLLLLVAVVFFYLTFRFVYRKMSEKCYNEVKGSGEETV